MALDAPQRVVAGIPPLSKAETSGRANAGAVGLPSSDGMGQAVYSPLTSPWMARMITHTADDKAVGLAYPIASRLRKQVASGIGDANDPYGGLGRNGAQKTPEVDAAQTVMDEDYGNALRAGKIYDLEATGIIKGHGDVRNIHVARTLWAAMCAAP